MKQKFFAALLALAAIAMPARAQNPYTKTIEPVGYQMYFSSFTLAATASSSFTVIGQVMGWTASVRGGTASFKVAQSTNSLNSGSYSLLISSTMFMASGDNVGEAQVRAQFINPIWFLQSLSAGASFYLDVSYLGRKDPQDPTGWGDR